MPEPSPTRADTFWDLYDFSTGRGLEIGPLHRTIVHRERADVRYVDVHDRDGLLAHYDDHTSVNPDLIPDIDYWLIQDDGRTLSLVEATAAGAPFAWVVASHVIEHIPDVIGWLDQIAEIAEDGAALVLAVPDRRYCFDVNRPPTTVGQMIQAHEAGDVRPSVRAVYDYFSSVVDYDVIDLWRGHTPGYDRRLHSLQEAGEKVAATIAGTYVDSHVWLFTPQSFLEQLHELRITGRSAWVVEELVPTAALDLEFSVVMRRLPRGTDTTGEQASEVLSTADRPDWFVPVDPVPLVDGLSARVAKLNARLADRRTKLEKVREKARRREERDKQTIATLRRELEDLRGSQQWRAGAAALAPARAVRRLRRR